MEKYNYKIIYAIVKEDILKGVYPTGTLMPTELTLVKSIMCHVLRYQKFIINYK